MPPLQSFGVIVTKDLTTVLGTAQLCPQTGCFFNLKKDAMVFIEAAIGDRPLVAQAQHLVEQFFGCHPRQRYTPIPPKSARNPSRGCVFISLEDNCPKLRDVVGCRCSSGVNSCRYQQTFY